MALDSRKKKIINVLIVDITLIILGIICFAAPGLSRSVFDIVLGCILILIGVVNLTFGAFLHDIGFGRTIISAVFITLGILVCFNNTFLNTFIVVFIGVLALFQALRECLHGFILKGVAVPLREYIYYFINALVLLALAILMFVDAATEMLLRMYVLGLMFLYYGVTDILDLVVELRNYGIEKDLKKKSRRKKREEQETYKETPIDIDPSKVVEVEVKDNKEE